MLAQTNLRQPHRPGFDAREFFEVDIENDKSNFSEWWDPLRLDLDSRQKTLPLRT